MMLKSLFFLCAVLCSCSSCTTPTPPPVPIPVALDAPVTDPCARACANLAMLGCKEGSDTALCYKSCSIVLADHVADFNTPCLAAAQSKEEARACKSVSCP